MGAEQYKKPRTYAVKHKNEEIRKESRSGGIFTALTDKVLAGNGVVYGCALMSDFTAEHIRATDRIERDRMRGSKYIQSKMGDTFSKVKEDLRQRTVLFSGTPCQVAGLLSFLGEHPDNLICVDIVCHGVPSELVWKAYLEYQEKSAQGKIVGVDFRNKQKFGWASHRETLKFLDGREIDSKVYAKLFYDHAILRLSCYQCPYKQYIHPGDITIADYWGIEKAVPEFNDNQGVSLVLINNDRGAEMFSSVKEEIVWKETMLDQSLQPPLYSSFGKPRNREQFWKDFEERDFIEIIQKYGHDTKAQRLRKSLSRYASKVLKECKKMELRLQKR